MYELSYKALKDFYTKCARSHRHNRTGDPSNQNYKYTTKQLSEQSRRTVDGDKSIVTITPKKRSLTVIQTLLAIGSTVNFIMSWDVEFLSVVLLFLMGAI